MLFNQYVNSGRTLRNEGLSDEEFQKRLIKDVNEEVYNEDVSEELNEMLSRNIEGYTPPTPEEAEKRAKITEKARASMNSFLLHTQNHMKDYGFGVEDSRWLETILTPVLNVKDANEHSNDLLVEKIKSRDPEKLHSVFESIMETLSALNPDDVLKQSDEMAADNLESQLHTLMIAQESGKILEFLKKNGLEPTEQEEQAFFDLCAPLETCYFAHSAHLSEILDTNYAKVDISQLKADVLDNTLLSSITDGPLSSENQFLQARENELQGRKQVTTFSIRDALDNDPRFKDDPIRDFEISYSPETVNVGSNLVSGRPYQDSTEHIKDLADGKTLYVHEKGGAGRVIPIRDFVGNGTVTIVPDEVKEPGFLAKVTHNVLKALGSDGLKSCRDYEAYQDKMASLEKAAKKYPKPLFAEYKKGQESYKAVHKVWHEKLMNQLEVEKVKKRITDINAKFVNDAERTDRTYTLIEDMLGPDADGGELIGKNFSRDVFNPKPIELPEDCPFSPKEFALIACACASEEKLLPLQPWRNNPNSTQEEKLAAFFTHGIRDTFVTVRPMFAANVNHLEKARENALEYIQEYQNGSKEDLAKAIGNAFAQSVMSTGDNIGLGSETKQMFDLQSTFYTFLTKTPDLMKFSGVKQETIDKYKANLVYLKAQERSMESEKKLLELLRDGTEMPEAEKAQCLKQILVARGMDHFDKMSTDALQSSQEFVETLMEGTQVSHRAGKANNALSDAQKNNASPEEIQKLQAEADKYNTLNEAYAAREYTMQSKKAVSPLRIEIGKMHNPEKGLEFVESYIEKTTSYQALLKADNNALRSYLVGDSENISRKVFSETNKVIEAEKAAEQKAMALQSQKNVQKDANVKAAPGGMIR